MNKWEAIFKSKVAEIATSDDPAHDLLHFERVVKTAKQLCVLEKGIFEIVVPAAWLHDFVIVPKNDSRRAQASRLSAKAAIEYLASINYPEIYFNKIANAIEAHSFSANIAPETLEAKIVQDADRLDGLGAIGIARCFATTGILKSAFYSDNDPFCKNRAPDDQSFTVDHFYKKLFKIADSMQTEFGKKEGQRRILIMQRYLEELSLEI